MKTRLPRSVLLALGLTASCDRCHTTHVGPCLEFVPEAVPEPAPDRPVRIGPCLKYAPEPAPEPVPEPDTGIQPCLEFAPEPDEEPVPEPEGSEQGALPADGARQRVLARGVLPEDVAALLRKRRG